MCGIICFIQYGGQKIDLVSCLNCLDKLNNRGPDAQSYQVIELGDITIFLGFTRLAIMDTSEAGLQPFKDNNSNYSICNGEIYNYKNLAEKFNIEMQSQCDCEILLPLFNLRGFEGLLSDLDAEFATVIVDKYNSKLYAARDKYGVRPLYYGYNCEKGLIGFASELKALHSVMEYVEQVKPNQYVTIDLSFRPSIPFDLQNFVKLFQFTNYHEYYQSHKSLIDYHEPNIEQLQTSINHLLTEAVRKRLYADRQIGFLLSGGLDSSLIVAIATRLLGPTNIVCFSVGFEGSPDVAAAREVVKFLGIKNHHIVPFSVDIGLNAINDVIKTIETYDITTIRASTPQFIMAKYIQENTDIRVLLSGEGSDEIHGSYKYMRSAPNSQEFHKETIRLLEELYLFDNKRTDRTMAGNGLEVRVPFLDFNYVDFIMNIDPNLLMYKSDYIEKKIIRDAFKGYLPENILYRPKEAFSDAVSSKEINWYRSIQKITEEIYTDEKLQNSNYKFNKPEIKEALYYRDIFNSHYGGRDHIIPHYWLPRFQQNNVLDPSATILPI
ncbi:glutamine-dependent asparagine synthetase [Acanthamoeba castellanii mimivirus]|uniref:Probable asparagine synthetase [glutamine-hydrolyzing] n=5 Tax=Mimivirus TaxID=315393 RepID=ASNS_MIMIV|nr:glutamine-dependent asparagine synthetase [Acanthamoeba polyphaga mimivirus]Q5UQE1.3 RecName: Full=Probable asparagine synthetase [glutamine-hydrolyzing]; AltName: Full=Glutamine-dependent asparagine synthetase [Acanthamoeba polyphaga mimivirus]AHA45384.1 glutamine-dependent asparagine synthetase [Hirudovirus strain Sangsue]ALR84065.1 glutamine-dependent asparagine synthetase [Niemeyer virus]AMK61910.1 glutamine-dependent asparagine synthetase [Samba virus]AMZ02919.1 glutamine-dependent asp